MGFKSIIKLTNYMKSFWFTLQFQFNYMNHIMMNDEKFSAKDTNYRNI